MCCKAGEEGGKRGSLGVMGVSERIGQEEGVRETWKVMEKEGILEKEGTVKKVERLLLVRAEFRIISGKSHSIYLQVALLSSLSLPLCLHPPSFCMLSVLFCPKPDKLPSSYFIIHYLPFLFGILRYVISFLCISLTICPAPY